MTFENPAGWHVIIGDNGAGKSTVVRSIALGIIGPNDSRALRLKLQDYIKKESKGEKFISLEVSKSEGDLKIGKSRPRVKPFEAKISIVDGHNSVPFLKSDSAPAFENIWSNANGWFSCAFGPFRRFTGGDKEWQKVYYSEPRAAAHLSVFGEDVALTEALDWIKELHIKNLEKRSSSLKSNFEESDILKNLISFLENTELLPHQARIKSISSEGIFFEDGNGALVDVTQMSDGYRSVLSLTFELIRQMIRSYPSDNIFKNFQNGKYTIDLPGVVLIDEIDAHLHPSWQTKIGNWFLKVFPNVQFIVTTHSPLVCRASENGSIWRLRAPGSDYPSGQITGVEYEKMIYGDILDAYGTELFGQKVTRSIKGSEKLNRLATLNVKSTFGELEKSEKGELKSLRKIFPADDTTEF